MGLTATLALSVGMAVMSKAQPSQERPPRCYVYLFDCTSSMKTGPQPVWSPARTALAKTLGRVAKQQPESRFTVVAFKDKKKIPAADVITFTGKRYNADKQREIDDLLEREVNGPQKQTNIVSALKRGFDQCDPAAESRIYLLTDGAHNCSDAGSAEDCVKDLCHQHAGDARFFYVAMTEAAVDKNMEQCLEGVDNGFLVECKNNFIPQIADIGSHVAAKSYELDKDYTIEFSEAGSLPVRIECADPFFDAKLVGEGAVDGRISVRFASRKGLSQEELGRELSPHRSGDSYVFTIKVTSGNDEYFIANSEVKVAMRLPLRGLTIFGGETGPLATVGAKWHDSFLWSPEAPDQPVEIDFAPVFETWGDGSAATFSLQGDGGPVDYTLTYNGLSVEPGGKIMISQRDAEPKLMVWFNHGAKEGERAFALTLERMENLDLVNGETAGDFQAIGISLSYDEVQNPLAKVCLWLAAVIVALFLIWVIALGSKVYPSVDVNILHIVADGVNVRRGIKGYRQVVLTSRARRQGVLSRIFTGKVLYIGNTEFTHEIRIEKNAAGGVRFFVPRPWSMSPTTSLRRNGSGTLTNTITHKGYQVSIF